MKGLVPKRKNERIAFGALMFGGPLTLWYEIYQVIPSYKGNTLLTKETHMCVIFFLTLQIYSNLYYTIVKHSQWNFALRTSKQIPEHEKKDWHYCKNCNDQSPPRSHHCPICDQCILKRDHHCWFAGTCIGHSNHRYYLVMVSYMWIAALYCNVLNYWFVEDCLGGISIGTVFCMFTPHVSLLFGYVTLYQAFVGVMSLLGFLTLLLITWLMQIQCVQLYRGQTDFEHKKNILDYDLGLLQNIIDVLGKRPLFTYLSPLMRSELTCDGFMFKHRDKSL